MRELSLYSRLGLDRSLELEAMIYFRLERPAALADLCVRPGAFIFLVFSGFNAEGAPSCVVAAVDNGTASFIYCFCGEICERVRGSWWCADNSSVGEGVSTSSTEAELSVTTFS